MEYYTMTTNAGDESVANSILTGIKTTFKKLAVGDGNGSYYEPAKTQAALRREVWRGDAAVSIDPTNPKRVIIMATIPATVGGFTVREAGVFDTANTLMVVSKMPLSEKVSPDSGASTDLVIRIYVEVSDVDAVTITVDPSAIQAFKSDVDAVANKAAQDLQSHANDTVAHVTQDEQNEIASAVQSATIGGSEVPKSGTTLQLPAYPPIPSSLPNPSALNVAVGNGGNTGSYTGVSALSITIPKVTKSTTATPSYTLEEGELYFSPN